MSKWFSVHLNRILCTFFEKMGCVGASLSFKVELMQSLHAYCGGAANIGKVDR
jgi:hypothetical protein